MFQKHVISTKSRDFFLKNLFNGKLTKFYKFDISSLKHESQAEETVAIIQIFGIFHHKNLQHIG